MFIIDKIIMNINKMIRIAIEKSIINEMTSLSIDCTCGSINKEYVYKRKKLVQEIQKDGMMMSDNQQSSTNDVLGIDDNVLRRDFGRERGFTVVLMLI